jgi:SAM-dependent methyltransferase
MFTLADHRPSPHAARSQATHATTRPHPHSACRTCDSGTERLLDLGRAPVVVGDVQGDDDVTGITAPLRLARCGACGMLQLEDVLNADDRFLVATATSQRAFAGRPEHARRFCEEAIDRWRLRGEGLVVEVGSGTGSLLRFFRAWQLPVLGVEPDERLTRYARLRRIPTWCATFDTALAERVASANAHADLLIISTPIAAFAQIRQLFAAAATVLRPGGVVTFEVPDVLRVVGRTRFDGLRHTAGLLPSIRQLQAIVATHGMDVIDVERGDTAGDRLRLWVRNRQQAASAVGHPRLRTRLRAEAAHGVEHHDTVTAFANRVDMVRHHIRGLLDHAAEQRRTVAAWGMSPEAVALAFAAGLNHRNIAYAVDPETISGCTVLHDTDIVVLGVADVADRRPDLVLALDDLPMTPQGWEGVQIYAVTDLVDLVHQLTDDPAVQSAR